MGFFSSALELGTYFPLNFIAGWEFIFLSLLGISQPAFWSEKGDFINYVLPVWRIAPLWGNFWQISWCASPQIHIQVIWTWPIMNKAFPATEHWFCIIINQGLTAEYWFCFIINWGLKVTAVWQVFSNHLLAVSVEGPRTGRAGNLNTDLSLWKSLQSVLRNTSVPREGAEG